MQNRYQKLACLVGITLLCSGCSRTVKSIESGTIKQQVKKVKLKKQTKKAKSKPKKKKTSLTSYTKSVMDKNHLTGAIGIVKNGKLKIVTRGMADAGSRTSNRSKQVVYPIGSMQKEITGAMMIRVMKQKGFSQNTKISKWYPNLKHAKKVTVGNLLTHTSGYAVPNIEQARYQMYTDQGAINWTVSQVNMTKQSSVGTYRYSDVNFVLLAGIIQKATGKSYSRNFKELVAKPLHLTHTYVRRDLPQKLHLATSYQYVKPYNYQNVASYTVPMSTQVPGAGNLVSTPADFFKIQKGLENGKILTKGQFHQLTHLKTKKNLYSGGVYLKKHETIHLAYGALDGVHYAAYMQLTRDNKNGIIMLVNQRQQNRIKFKRIGYQILKQIKPHTFSKY